MREKEARVLRAPILQGIIFQACPERSANTSNTDQRSERRAHPLRGRLLPHPNLGDISLVIYELRYDREIARMAV